jgi:hypothetical protein
MNLDRLKIILIAVGVAGAVALFLTRGPQQRLEGEFTEVRLLKVEETATVALVNFAAENVTNRPFVANDRNLELINADGRAVAGMLVSGPDLYDLFKYFPDLGGMKDEPFLAKRRIESGESFRGLIAARFEVPESLMQQRQGLVLRLVDGAGRPTEIREDAR